MSELLGASHGIPMRPCQRCNYPAAYDAFGQTDHVCYGETDALMLGLFPANKKQRVVIIESTACGASNGFYDQWQRWRSEHE